MVEKEMVCCIGARSEGRRKVGGIWLGFVDFKIRFIEGRRAWGADILELGCQFQFVDELFSSGELQYNFRDATTGKFGLP